MTSREHDILNAAKDCFLRYGYRRSSMDDIAQETGFSRPAVYQYFKSKEAIFNAVSEMVINEAFAKAERALREGQQPHEQIRSYLTAYNLYFHDLLNKGPHSEELLQENHKSNGNVRHAAHDRLVRNLNSLLNLSAEDEVGQVLALSAEGIKHYSGSRKAIETRLALLASMAKAHLQMNGKKIGNNAD
nr:helix-turn-helix domain-containing protein [uncultured Cohaesibacter sp.]